MQEIPIEKLLAIIGKKELELEILRENINLLSTRIKQLEEKIDDSKGKAKTN